MSRRPGPHILRDRSYASRAERALDLLDLELSLGTARRHLDPLLELVELYLAGCTPTLERDALAARAARARERVSTRVNLRLCKVRSPQ